MLPDSLLLLLGQGGVGGGEEALAGDPEPPLEDPEWCRPEPALGDAGGLEEETWAVEVGRVTLAFFLSVILLLLVCLVGRRRN